jgi:S-adenosylmethionine hydrolase
MPLISLTTDFGDLYPAAMKAVILGINPDVRIIDITHSIRQAGIREGAFALYSLAPYFPAKTVHIGIDGPFLVGEVIFVDKFGNVIVNIPEDVILRFFAFGSEVEVNGRKVPFVRTYGFAGREMPRLISGLKTETPWR